VISLVQEEAELALGRQSSYEHLNLFFRARLPQRVQQPGDIAGLVKDELGGCAGCQCGGLLVGARLPQHVK
jgi:hypothetical protein